MPPLSHEPTFRAPPDCGDAAGGLHPASQPRVRRVQRRALYARNRRQAQGHRVRTGQSVQRLRRRQHRCVSMPLIEVVPVAGLTTQRAERAIEAKLRNGFIREPRVAVEINAFRPFYILGEVTTPGQYPFVTGLTIQKAAAIASGFTPRADRYQAEITRQVSGGV